MNNSFLGAGLCLTALLLGACTTTNVQTSKSATISWTAPTKRVLLIEPDVKLGELEAGGSIDWRADWSKTGTDFIEKDIHDSLAAHGVDVAQSGALTEPHAVQLVKLHDVVGGAIIRHALIGGVWKLPTKSEPLDFTLGPGAMDLHDKYGADYAVFVTVRDSYTTAGRAVLMLGMAMLGVGITGGQQSGFASLIDLKTGNVVWFNMIASQGGDLRTEKPAKAVVDNLMKGLPL